MNDVGNGMTPEHAHTSSLASGWSQTPRKVLPIQSPMDALYGWDDGDYFPAKSQFETETSGDAAT